MANESWNDRISDLLRNTVSKEVKAKFKEMDKTGEWCGRRTTGGHVMLRHVNGSCITLVVHGSNPRNTAHTISEIKKAQAGIRGGCERVS